MAESKLNSPGLFLNRELSWLEFNDRVLREGLSGDLPLLERLKFLAIVSSNLDEFFMIRVAGLMQQRSANLRKRDISGMTPARQITAIGERTHRMVAEQSAGLSDVLALLGVKGLHLLSPDRWSPRQQRFCHDRFAADILPVLTPLAIQGLDPCPLMPAMQLVVAVRLAPKGGSANGTRIVAVPVPGALGRFISLPAEEGRCLVCLEDVIAENIGMLFTDCDVLATSIFRITRDADVAIQDDEAGDLLEAVEQAVRQRRRRAAVRLEISARPDPQLRQWLVDWLDIRPEDIYEIDGMLDAAALMDVAMGAGFDQLKIPAWPPQTPPDLVGEDDLYHAIATRDILLVHPYESFDPVVRLAETAAEDPSVLAIKQVLYRTSGDSPIVRALETAAQAGKEVTVLVELKARFDEARNVVWARRLEDAGCHVIYGIAGLKTHAKALLIVRREGDRIRRYVHLATGNYNDKTAKLYSDIGLMTRNRRIAGDVAAFFNLLTGYSEDVGWSELAISPTGLRNHIIDMIDREIAISTPDQPGLIMAKVNSLHDRKLCHALYRASQAGVTVRLNVRGICCLRPGMKGVSENIEVRSIVDRFLEHARIMRFGNGGNEEVYLSSADWMGRNLDKRLELLFPVHDSALRRRLIRDLDTYFADNVKAYVLRADGTYERVKAGEPAIRAQEVLYQQAAQAAQAAASTVRYRPISRPED